MKFRKVKIVRPYCSEAFSLFLLFGLAVLRFANPWADKHSMLLLWVGCKVLPALTISKIGYRCFGSLV